MLCISPLVSPYSENKGAISQARQAARCVQRSPLQGEVRQQTVHCVKTALIPAGAPEGTAARGHWRRDQGPGQQQWVTQRRPSSLQSCNCHPPPPFAQRPEEQQAQLRRSSRSPASSSPLPPAAVPGPFTRSQQNSFLPTPLRSLQPPLALQGWKNTTSPLSVKLFFPGHLNS